MLTDLLPFSLNLNATMLSGIALWSLALYLGFFPVSEWVMDKLAQWFNHAERSFYTEAEYERTRKGREAQNAFLASLTSIIPFLAIGILCNWAVEAGLGRSWTVSMGILACIGCGVYELGRRDGQSIDE